MSRSVDIKQMISAILDKTTIIGSAGFGASMMLKDISVIISIVVGILTCIHVGIKIYHQINRKK